MNPASAETNSSFLIPHSSLSAAPPSAAPLNEAPCADVAIVILNWNGARFLRQFLPAVLAHAAGARVVVADNASTDDSVELLAREFSPVELILLDSNLGFCEGYNQALKQIDSPYFVLLNSDVAVRPGWLPPLRALLAANPRIAAAQPKLLAHHDPRHFEYAGAAGGYLDRLAYPFCRGRLFDTLELDTGQYDDPRPVAWASGACCLVRASVWQALGGLEPAFFAHMEEIDFCWRARNAGHEIWYAGGASVVQHVGGGTLPKSSPRKTYLNFRNGLALLYKNTAPTELRTALTQRVLLDWLAAVKFLLGFNLPEFRAVLRAHRHVWAKRGYWQQQRAGSGIKKPAGQQVGVYNGSVVWAYFFRGKRTFADVPGLAHARR